MTPGGASLLACTVLDALRGGFDEVAVVVRPEIRSTVQSHLAEHLGAGAPLSWIHQPEPLGTAHAVLVAWSQLGRPPSLAVANGDDLYGHEAMAELVDAAGRLAPLRDDAGCRPAAALVGYRMAATLSGEGGVSRGWVRTAPGEPRRVVSVEEYLEVRRRGGELRGRRVTPEGSPEAPSPIAADAVASMNLWALNAGAVELLEEACRSEYGAERAAAEGVAPDAGWRETAGGGGSPGRGADGPTVTSGARAAEFSLAPELDRALRRGRLEIDLAGVATGWIGLTFAGDLPAARDHMREQHAAGRYPEPLADGVPRREDGGRTSS